VNSLFKKTILANAGLRRFWLQFMLVKSLWGARFAKPFQRSDEEASILEFIPYLAWECIKLGYSKLGHRIQRKRPTSPDES
jgi:hypothetical protein